MSKCNLKNGNVSRYGFCCGYMEVFEQNNIRTQLYLDGLYNVRTYDHNTHSRIIWLSFETIREARKEYRKQIRDIKKGIKL